MEDIYKNLLSLETTPQALDATAQYLADKMQPFLYAQEPVLICYPDEGAASLGGIFKEAVLRCNAKPVFWGPDFRWKELLRLAFETHANTVIAHPLVALGLMKIARATATPLYIYDLIVCGDPFSYWMVEDLKKGLDCHVWGCYAVRSGPVVAGFSCEQESGIHIREEVFEPLLHSNTDGKTAGNRGRLYFAASKDPEQVFDPEQLALIHYQNCACGCDGPVIAEVASLAQTDLSREMLENEFLAWSSVLDYRAEMTESGMSLELVIFPGESLPKVPSVAKLNVRPWNPDDIPFCMQKYTAKIPEKIYERD